MPMNSQDYAPYFRDGLLFLPPKTVELLVRAGLSADVAQASLNGLTLDDDRPLIGAISDKLVTVLGEIAENSHAYQQLNSQLTYFMLTGKPA
jgi:hypothetical protein